MAQTKDHVINTAFASFAVAFNEVSFNLAAVARVPDQPRSAAVFQTRQACYFRGALIALSLGCVGPLCALDDGWLDWLNPELRQLALERVTFVRELESLGVPSVGHTVTEYGYQHPLLATPADTPAWVQIDLGQKQPIDCVAVVPALSSWQSFDRTAHGFPLRWRVDLSDQPDFKPFVPLASFTEKDFPDPGIIPVTISARGQAARYVRITVTKMAFENDRYFYALAEVMVLSGNLNVAVHRRVQASEAGRSMIWKTNNLVDSRTPLGPPIRTESVPREGFYIFPEEGAIPEISIDLGREYVLQQVRLHPVHARQAIDTPGVAFPIGFRLEAGSFADFNDAIVLFAPNKYPNPGNNPVTIRVKDIAARYLRIVITVPTRMVGLSEIEVYTEGRNVAREAKITATPDRSDRPERWPESLLNDGFTSYGRLIELPEWLRGWDRRRELNTALAQVDQRKIAATERARQRALWLASIGGVLALATVAGLQVASKHKRTRELHALRMRLSHDLHDEIGSNLAGIAALSQIAQRQNLSAEAAQKDWVRVQQIAQETTEAMHEVLWLVGGREDVDLDIESQFKLVASRMLPHCEVRWRTALAALPEDWPSESRRQLFLFFKEVLANVARHSRATCVAVSVGVDRGQLRLEIADNGIGFEVKRAFRGTGLASLRERARALGGRVSVESAPAHGTRVELTAPIARRQPLNMRVWARG